MGKHNPNSRRSYRKRQKTRKRERKFNKNYFCNVGFDTSDNLTSISDTDTSRVNSYFNLSGVENINSTEQGDSQSETIKIENATKTVVDQNKDTSRGEHTSQAKQTGKTSGQKGTQIKTTKHAYYGSLMAKYKEYTLLKSRMKVLSGEDT